MSHPGGRFGSVGPSPALALTLCSTGGRRGTRAAARHGTIGSWHPGAPQGVKGHRSCAAGAETSFLYLCSEALKTKSKLERVQGIAAFMCLKKESVCHITKNRYDSSVTCQAEGNPGSCHISCSIKNKQRKASHLQAMARLLSAL